MEPVSVKTKVIGVGILVVGAVVAAAAFTLNQMDKQNRAQEEQVWRAAQTAKIVVSPTPTPINLPPQPKVTVEDEMKIGPVARTELTLKVINPFVDYYKEASQGALLTLTITPNSSDNSTSYPFLANAEFDTGVKLGFVVEQTQGSLKYWKPECMNGCVFSEEYKDKYPEVVK